MSVSTPSDDGQQQAAAFNPGRRRGRPSGGRRRSLTGGDCLRGPRDLYVISDLHLGDGGLRDNFELKGRPARFAAFLDHVEAERGRLLILGDLFEFWQANLGTVLVRHEPLLDRLARLRARYVVGNHDVDLLPLIGRRRLLAHPFFRRMSGPFIETLTLAGQTRTVCFMHGHEVDSLNNSLVPGQGRLLSIFAGLFEDGAASALTEAGTTVESDLEEVGERVLAFGRRVTGWLARLRILPSGMRLEHSAETPVQNRRRVAQTLAALERHRVAERCDLLVAGHTHQPGLWPDAAAPTLVNSGGWAMFEQGEPLNTYVRLSPREGIAVSRWV